jgi:predicted nucleic acid-binding protein
MKYLLDTNVCIIYIKGRKKRTNSFFFVIIYNSTKVFIYQAVQAIASLVLPLEKPEV